MVVIVGVVVAVRVMVGVAVRVVVGVAVMVGVRVVVGVCVRVGVAEAVGVGVLPNAPVSNTACAVSARVLELDPLAGKVGDATPENGAAKSALTSVKPSFEERRL